MENKLLLSFSLPTGRQQHWFKAQTWEWSPPSLRRGRVTDSSSCLELSTLREELFWRSLPTPRGHIPSPSPSWSGRLLPQTPSLCAHQLAALFLRCVGRFGHSEVPRYLLRFSTAHQELTGLCRGAPEKTVSGVFSSYTASFSDAACWMGCGLTQCSSGECCA